MLMVSKSRCTEKSVAPLFKLPFQLCLFNFFYFQNSKMKKKPHWQSNLDSQAFYLKVAEKFCGQCWPKGECCESKRDTLEKSAQPAVKRLEVFRKFSSKRFCVLMRFMRVLFLLVANQLLEVSRCPLNQTFTLLLSRVDLSLSFFLTLDTPEEAGFPNARLLKSPITCVRTLVQ